MRFLGKTSSGSQRRASRGRKPSFQTLEERQVLDGVGVLIAGASGDDSFLSQEDSTSQQAFSFSSEPAAIANGFGEGILDLLSLSSTRGAAADRIISPPAPPGVDSLADLINPFTEA